MSKEIGIKKRLKKLQGGQSGAGFARHCGIAQTTMSGYLTGSSSPGLKAIEQIAAACNVSPAWLATGEKAYQPLAEDQVNLQLGSSQGGKPKDKDYYPIPLYDVQASAGPGAYIDGEQVQDVMALRKNWIQNELHLDPAHLSLIFVQGDSMEPTMHSGDTVLIDQREDQDLTDGVWALRIDGALLVKRVQKFPGGKITIKSDNQYLYPAYDIMSDNVPDDLKFIGRVVWVGKRM
jgi:phage repressor protein C with HTH and peptisase S24 domain